jgi:hypothetical protein
MLGRAVALSRLAACSLSLCFAFASPAVAQSNYAAGNLATSGPFALSASIGPIFSRFNASYSSNGNQEPGSFSANSTGISICGGPTVYYPIANTRFQYGGGLNFCGETTGSVTLFQTPRHPNNGHVTAEVDPGVRVEPFIGVHIDLTGGPGAASPFDHAMFRAGPVFAHNKLSATSDQTGAGGQFESASTSDWITGFGLTGGLSSKLCPNCLWGRPLSLNLLAKVVWFRDSQSVVVHSSQFNFDETITLDSSTQISVLLNLSTPLGGLGQSLPVSSDRRLKRDIVRLASLDNGLGLYRYRYLWSDTVHVGVMAQEVALAQPHAVVRGADGYLRVDYAQLGLRLQTWDEWALERVQQKWIPVLRPDAL